MKAASSRTSRPGSDTHQPIAKLRADIYPVDRGKSRISSPIATTSSGCISSQSHALQRSSTTDPSLLKAQYHSLSRTTQLNTGGCHSTTSLLRNRQRGHLRSFSKAASGLSTRHVRVALSRHMLKYRKRQGIIQKSTQTSPALRSSRRFGSTLTKSSSILSSGFSQQQSNAPFQSNKRYISTFYKPKSPSLHPPLIPPEYLPNRQTETLLVAKHIPTSLLQVSDQARYQQQMADGPQSRAQVAAVSKLFSSILGLPLLTTPDLDTLSSNLLSKHFHKDAAPPSFLQQHSGRAYVESKRHTYLLETISKHRTLFNIPKIANIGQLSVAMTAYTNISHESFHTIADIELFTTHLNLMHKVVPFDSSITPSLYIPNKTPRPYSPMHSVLALLEQLSTLHPLSRGAISSSSVRALLSLMETFINMDELELELLGDDKYNNPVQGSDFYLSHQDPPHDSSSKRAISTLDEHDQIDPDSNEEESNQQTTTLDGEGSSPNATTKGDVHTKQDGWSQLFHMNPSSPSDIDGSSSASSSTRRSSRSKSNTSSSRAAPKNRIHPGRLLNAHNSPLKVTNGNHYSLLLWLFSNRELFRLIDKVTDADFTHRQHDGLGGSGPTDHIPSIVDQVRAQRKAYTTELEHFKQNPSHLASYSIQSSDDVHNRRSQTSPPPQIPKHRLLMRYSNLTPSMLDYYSYPFSSSDQRWVPDGVQSLTSASATTYNMLHPVSLVEARNYYHTLVLESTWNALDTDAVISGDVHRQHQQQPSSTNSTQLESPSQDAQLRRTPTDPQHQHRAAVPLTEDVIYMALDHIVDILYNPTTLTSRYISFLKRHDIHSAQVPALNSTLSILMHDAVLTQPCKASPQPGYKPSSHMLATYTSHSPSDIKLMLQIYRVASSLGLSSVLDFSWALGDHSEHTDPHSDSDTKRPAAIQPLIQRLSTELITPNWQGVTSTGDTVQVESDARSRPRASVQSPTISLRLDNNSLNAVFDEKNGVQSGTTTSPALIFDTSSFLRKNWLAKQHASSLDASGESVDQSRGLVPFDPTLVQLASQQLIHDINAAIYRYSKTMPDRLFFKASQRQEQYYRFIRRSHRQHDEPFGSQQPTLFPSSITNVYELPFHILQMVTTSLQSHHVLPQGYLRSTIDKHNNYMINKNISSYFENVLNHPHLAHYSHLDPANLLNNQLHSKTITTGQHLSLLLQQSQRDQQLHHQSLLLKGPTPSASSTSSLSDNSSASHGSNKDAPRHQHLQHPIMLAATDRVFDVYRAIVPIPRPDQSTTFYSKLVLDAVLSPDPSVDLAMPLFSFIYADTDSKRKQLLQHPEDVCILPYPRSAQQLNEGDLYSVYSTPDFFQNTNRGSNSTTSSGFKTTDSMSKDPQHHAVGNVKKRFVDSSTFDLDCDLAVYQGDTAKKIRSACDYGGAVLFLHPIRYDTPTTMTSLTTNPDSRAHAQQSPCCNISTLQKLEMFADHLLNNQPLDLPSVEMMRDRIEKKLHGVTSDRERSLIIEAELNSIHLSKANHVGHAIDGHTPQQQQLIRKDGTTIVDRPLAESQKHMDSLPHTLYETILLSKILLSEANHNNPAVDPSLADYIHETSISHYIARLPWPTLLKLDPYHFNLILVATQRTPAITKQVIQTYLSSLAIAKRAEVGYLTNWNEFARYESMLSKSDSSSDNTGMHSSPASDASDTPPGFHIRHEKYRNYDDVGHLDQSSLEAKSRSRLVEEEMQVDGYDISLDSDDGFLMNLFKQDLEHTDLQQNPVAHLRNTLKEYFSTSPSFHQVQSIFSDKADIRQYNKTRLKDIENQMISASITLMQQEAKRKEEQVDREISRTASQVASRHVAEKFTQRRNLGPMDFPTPQHAIIELSKRTPIRQKITAQIRKLEETKETLRREHYFKHLYSLLSRDAKAAEERNLRQQIEQIQQQIQTLQDELGTAAHRDRKMTSISHSSVFAQNYDDDDTLISSFAIKSQLSPMGMINYPRLISIYKNAVERQRVRALAYGGGARSSVLLEEHRSVDGHDKFNTPSPSSSNNHHDNINDIQRLNYACYIAVDPLQEKSTYPLPRVDGGGSDRDDGQELIIDAHVVSEHHDYTHQSPIVRDDYGYHYYSMTNGAINSFPHQVRAHIISYLWDCLAIISKRHFTPIANQMLTKIEQYNPRILQKDLLYGQHLEYLQLFPRRNARKADDLTDSDEYYDEDNLVYQEVEQFAHRLKTAHKLIAADDGNTTENRSERHTYNAALVYNMSYINRYSLKHMAQHAALPWLTSSMSPHFNYSQDVFTAKRDNILNYYSTLVQEQLSHSVRYTQQQYQYLLQKRHQSVIEQHLGLGTFSSPLRLPSKGSTKSSKYKHSTHALDSMDSVSMDPLWNAGQTNKAAMGLSPHLFHGGQLGIGNDDDVNRLLGRLSDASTSSAKLNPEEAQRSMENILSIKPVPYSAPLYVRDPLQEHFLAQRHLIGLSQPITKKGKDDTDQVPMLNLFVDDDKLYDQKFTNTVHQFSDTVSTSLFYNQSDLYLKLNALLSEQQRYTKAYIHQKQQPQNQFSPHLVPPLPLGSTLYQLPHEVKIHLPLTLSVLLNNPIYVDLRRDRHFKEQLNMLYLDKSPRNEANLVQYLREKLVRENNAFVTFLQEKSDEISHRLNSSSDSAGTGSSSYSYYYDKTMLKIIEYHRRLAIMKSHHHSHPRYDDELLSQYQTQRSSRILRERCLANLNSFLVLHHITPLEDGSFPQDQLDRLNFHNFEYLHGLLQEIYDLESKVPQPSDPQAKYERLVLNYVFPKSLNHSSTHSPMAKDKQTFQHDSLPKDDHIRWLQHLEHAIDTSAIMSRHFNDPQKNSMANRSPQATDEVDMSRVDSNGSDSDTMQQHDDDFRVYSDHFNRDFNVDLLSLYDSFHNKTQQGGGQGSHGATASQDTLQRYRLNSMSQSIKQNAQLADKFKQSLPDDDEMESTDHAMDIFPPPDVNSESQGLPRAALPSTSSPSTPAGKQVTAAVVPTPELLQQESHRKQSRSSSTSDHMTAFYQHLDKSMESMIPIRRLPTVVQRHLAHLYPDVPFSNELPLVKGSISSVTEQEVRSVFKLRVNNDFNRFHRAYTLPPDKIKNIFHSDASHELRSLAKQRGSYTMRSYQNRVQTAQKQLANETPFWNANNTPEITDDILATTALTVASKNDAVSLPRQFIHKDELRAVSVELPETLDHSEPFTHSLIQDHKKKIIDIVRQDLQATLVQHVIDPNELEHYVDLHLSALQQQQQQQPSPQTNGRSPMDGLLSTAHFLRDTSINPSLHKPAKVGSAGLPPSSVSSVQQDEPPHKSSQQPQVKIPLSPLLFTLNQSAQSLLHTTILFAEYISPRFTFTSTALHHFAQSLKFSPADDFTKALNRVLETSIEMSFPQRFQQGLMFLQNRDYYGAAFCYLRCLTYDLECRMTQSPAVNRAISNIIKDITPHLREYRQSYIEPTIHSIINGQSRQSPDQQGGGAAAAGDTNSNSTDSTMKLVDMLIHDVEYTEYYLRNAMERHSSRLDGDTILRRDGHSAGGVTPSLQSSPTLLKVLSIPPRLLLFEDNVTPMVLPSDDQLDNVDASPSALTMASTTTTPESKDASSPDNYRDQSLIEHSNITPFIYNTLYLKNIYKICIMNEYYPQMQKLTQVVLSTPTLPANDPIRAQLVQATMEYICYRLQDPHTAITYWLSLFRQCHPLSLSTTFMAQQLLPFAVISLAQGQIDPVIGIPALMKAKKLTLDPQSPLAKVISWVQPKTPGVQLPTSSATRSNKTHTQQNQPKSTAKVTPQAISSAIGQTEFPMYISSPLPSHLSAVYSRNTNYPPRISKFENISSQVFYQLQRKGIFH